jgi:ADP-ribose pyrophosphatase YjhB (NUDIX family)
MRNREAEWIMQLIESDGDIPDDGLVSAVFLVVLIQDSILAVRNERGWDIPGGHVEVGESSAIAVARETLEEAGAVFPWAEPFAILSLPKRRELMLFYTTSSCDLAPFSPNDDALERGMLPLDEFRNKYCGPTEVLEWLVEGARARLARM